MLKMTSKVLKCSKTKISVERHHKKTCLRVSDQIRHKLCCAATEDGLRLEISESRDIVVSM